MSNLMNIQQAITACTADLCRSGLAKASKNEQQGYRFRGIDDAMGAVSPVISRHGLVIIPSYSERTVTERQGRSGGALFYVTLRGEFKFVAPDGSSLTAVAYGEAMDSGDKATNKAMSAAFKYALLQTFCIPVEGTPDADSQTHEVEPAAPFRLSDADRQKHASALQAAEVRSDLVKAWVAAFRASEGDADAHDYLLAIKNARKAELEGVAA